MLEELGNKLLHNIHVIPHVLISSSCLMLSAWLFLFGVFVAVVTIILKIMIEFPGLLKFKCIYKEQSNDNLEEVRVAIFSFS